MKIKLGFVNSLRIKLSDLLVFLILCIGFFLRVYGINKFLGFYYDQGRDALVIWDFIHKGKFFLIGPLMGPTYGVGEVFRGSWYYWLVTPFYWLGGGNPVYPSIFLIFTTILSVYILFLITKKIGGTVSSYISLIISAFSFSLILYSHWLANPVPLLLISVLFFWSLILIVDGNRRSVFLSGFLAGMAMQFGGSADMFYFLIILLVIIFWSRKFINVKDIFLLFISYIFPFLPQMIFDLRHNGILRKGLFAFLHSQRSFSIPLGELIKTRLYLYADTFLGLVGYKMFSVLSVVSTVLLIVLLVNFKNLKKNKYFSLSLLVLFTPLLGMMFFKGDKGVIYGYYLSGYYMIFILIFSVLLGLLWKNFLGKLFVIGFLMFLSFKNFVLLNDYYKYNFRGFNPIILEDQLGAIGWILNDAKGKEFNVDVYVPPVIPYAYDYLFQWQVNQKCGENMCGLVKDRQVENLYTLYEKDPSHPERLGKWLKRQDGIGVFEKEIVLGGITVQKRKRI